jgi:hypothetical protein
VKALHDSVARQSSEGCVVARAGGIDLSVQDGRVILIREMSMTLPGWGAPNRAIGSKLLCRTKKALLGRTEGGYRTSYSSSIEITTKYLILRNYNSNSFAH